MFAECIIVSFVVEKLLSMAGRFCYPSVQIRKLRLRSAECQGQDFLAGDQRR